MKAYDFKVLLEPDETGGYVATCPSLPGCYSQGETVDGALDNIREAIELCLEDMQAHGEVIPDPSDGRPSAPWRVTRGPTGRAAAAPSPAPPPGQPLRGARSG
jgi:predicted RNase H-like HicB family nuclease